MHNERLYYDQPYLQEFATKIAAVKKTEDQWHINLEQTAFYPTSGGQPHDRGSINGIEVLDVYEEEDRVWHILAIEPESTQAECKLDWIRRYDFMQQHSGQHILSQAFWQHLRANTIGFHLTESSLTIDLDIADLTDEDLLIVEQEANRIVWSDRKILSHWCDDAQLSRMPLRKPPKVDKDIRVIEVAGYDWSPCGGTHTEFTAEVGIIKIRRWERSKAVTRIEFLCGQRALEDYRFKNHFTQMMAADLSIREQELMAGWDRQKRVLRETETMLRQARTELLHLTADGLFRDADTRKPYTLICRALEVNNLEELKQLSLLLAAHENCVALLGMQGEPAHFALARSHNLSEVDLQKLLRKAQQIFPGKGGGNPQGVQGLLSDNSAMNAFLQWLNDELQSQIG